MRMRPIKKLFVERWRRQKNQDPVASILKKYLRTQIGFCTLHFMEWYVILCKIMDLFLLCLHSFKILSDDDMHPKEDFHLQDKLNCSRRKLKDISTA